MIISISYEDKVINMQVDSDVMVMDLQEHIKDSLNLDNIDLYYYTEKLNPAKKLKTYAIKHYSLVLCVKVDKPEVVEPEHLPEQDPLIPLDHQFISSSEQSKNSARVMLKKFLHDPDLWAIFISLLPDVDQNLIFSETTFVGVISPLIDNDNTIMNRIVNYVKKGETKDFELYAKKKLELDQHLALSKEYNPEDSFLVTMLFVNLKIGDHLLYAFVDTGCQTSIISKRCAEKCNLMDLCDERFISNVKGVGEQKTVGRIHIMEVEIGKEKYHCSLTVLEHLEYDMMLGLDIIKKHRCKIDMESNKLFIGNSGNFTLFLNDHELPNKLRGMPENKG